MVMIADLLRVDKPLSTGASAVYPYSAQLEKKYRFTSRFDDEVLLHKVVGDTILLPRALCPVSDNDQRASGTPVVFPSAPTPRPDQVSWFGEAASFTKKGLSGMVVAGTGRGKTACGFFVAHALQVKTLVIVTKDDIYEQWLEGAQKFLGLDWSQIGEIRQDKCEIVGTSFCVAMIHSLSQEDKYDGIDFSEFGLILFDECHRLPADKFSRVADMFAAKVRVGLTATEERPDGKELLVQCHIGPVRVRAEAELMVPKIIRRVTAWQCPRVFRENKATGKKSVVRLPHEPGKTTHIEKILAADPERNAMIVADVRDAWEKGRKIVVFTTLLDHIKTLHRALVELGIPGKEIGIYGQASNKAEREQRDKHKVRSILLTTYGMMGEGTDIPWLDTCVLAMPRSQVKQPVGRVRREYEDKHFPAVIDYIDRDSPVFDGYSYTRLKFYKGMGAEIVDL